MIKFSYRSYQTSLPGSETESDAEDLYQQQLEEIGDRLNASSDRTGFLRMLSRAHVWNASSLSLGSLGSLSLNSTAGSLAGNDFARTRAGSIRSKTSSGRPFLICSHLAI